MGESQKILHIKKESEPNPHMRNGMNDEEGRAIVSTEVPSRLYFH